MRKWGLFVTGCYAVLLVALIVPAALFLASDSPSLRVTLELSASFFVDADHAAGLQRLAAIVRDDPPDAHLDLLAAVERFRLSKRRQPF